MSPDATKPEEVAAADKIVVDGKMIRDDSQLVHARGLVQEFATQVVDEGMVISDDVAAAINTRIAQVDKMISSQLSAILHAPEFQQLEASWRGLHQLVKNTETGTRDEAAAAQRHPEGAADRSGEGDRVRPERAVQEGLRGGVRHLRRPSLQLPGRRLRVRPASAGRRHAGDAVGRGRGGARPVHRRRQPEAVRPRELHRARGAARSGEELRDQRPDQVAVVPRHRGLALRRA